MSGLFRAVAAHRHAAPPPAPPPCVVREDERAAVSLARPNISEGLVAYALRQRFADRREQRLRRSPMPHRLQFQMIAVFILMRRYAAKHFVALKKRVERLEVADRFRGKRPPHVLAHEAPEPFA